MILAKLFQEQGGGEGFRSLVLSVGILQDLYAILLLAGMDTSSAASGGVGWALARVGLFLAGLLGLGGLLLPPLLRWAADNGRDETLLVASVGACFTCAVLASRAGCSPALGAFGSGMLAATSRRVRPIERLVLPLRDMFGAVFFVAVGMLLDPRLLLLQAGPILALTALLILGSTLGGTLGAAAAGVPVPTGFRVGLTLAQPGELSLVLVGVGSAANLVGPHALPMVVGATLLSAVAGPLLFRPGRTLGEALERALPGGLKRRLDAIEGWTAPRPVREAVRAFPAKPLASQGLYLLLDALAFNLLLLVTLRFRHHALALCLAGLPLAYLAWTLYHRAGRISGLLLETRSLGAVRQNRMLHALLLAGATSPGLLLLPPLLPRAPMLALLAGGLVCLGVLALAPAHRSPRMGAEWLLEHVQRPWGTAGAGVPAPAVLATLVLKADCPFNGKPMEDLRSALEDQPGLEVVAVQRAGQWLVCPPQFKLQAGDRVAVWGPGPALEAAERILG
jgi:CPA2 family monovalent cation:H+ antiporter-2